MTKKRKRVCGEVKQRRAKGGMNVTEAKFNETVLGGTGAYEAVTFKVAEGCKYTPDFCVWDADTGRLTCYEVKGSYPLPSENRARLAFLTCREKYTHVTFKWFKQSKDGTFEEKHGDAQ